MRFAQIETLPLGKKYVHWIFEADINPYDHHPDLDIRDITNQEPAPQEGWLVSEEGVYTQPEPEEIIVRKNELTFSQFQNHCYDCLGTLVTPDGTSLEKKIAGALRYGQVVHAVKVAADAGTGLSVAALERYDNGKLSNVFEYETTKEFFGLISSHITVQEVNLILLQWPTSIAR